MRHPVYGNEKNIHVRAPIDFVTIYKNEPNANKWIFDERGEGSRKVHTPRIDAPRGTQKRVENRTVDAHTCMRRLCIYASMHIYRVSQNWHYVFIHEFLEQFGIEKCDKHTEVFRDLGHKLIK